MCYCDYPFAVWSTADSLAKLWNIIQLQFKLLIKFKNPLMNSLTYISALEAWFWIIFLKVTTEHIAVAYAKLLMGVSQKLRILYNSFPEVNS